MLAQLRALESEPRMARTRQFHTYCRNDLSMVQPPTPSYEGCNGEADISDSPKGRHVPPLHAKERSAKRERKEVTRIRQLLSVGGARWLATAALSFGFFALAETLSPAEIRPRAPSTGAFDHPGDGKCPSVAGVAGGSRHLYYISSY